MGKKRVTMGGEEDELLVFNPKAKRWVALFTLLCWIVPFLGVISSSILAPVLAVNQPQQPNQGEPVPEAAADKTVAAGDHQTEVSAPAATETKHHQAGPVSVPPPPAQPKTVPEAAAASGGDSRDDGIDLHLLARVIYAEARGEPFEGQVAVGAVLINRVRNPKFPNDLWSVVFKKGEFCTVRDGQIWLEPDATAYRAARLAKAGWDPTNGALYFYNPSRTTSAWIWSRTVTARIGRHVFAV